MVKLMKWFKWFKWLQSWNGKVPPCHLPEDGLCYKRNTTKRKATHRLEDVMALGVYRKAGNGTAITFKRKAPWIGKHLRWYYFLEDEAGCQSSSPEWRYSGLEPIECSYQSRHVWPEELPAPALEWGVLGIRRTPIVFDVEIYDENAERLVASGSMLPFLVSKEVLNED